MKHQFGKKRITIQADPHILKEIIGNYTLCLVGRGYVRCTPKEKRSRHKVFFLHRYVLGVHDKKTPDHVVDHINHDKLDNRKRNLRLVDRTQNSVNSEKVPKNYTPYRGGFRVQFSRYGVTYRHPVKTEAEAKRIVRKFKKLFVFNSPHKGGK